jgi:hypothetical protein
MHSSFDAIGEEQKEREKQYNCTNNEGIKESTVEGLYSCAFHTYFQIFIVSFFNAFLHLPNNMVAVSTYLKQ